MVSTVLYMKHPLLVKIDNNIQIVSSLHYNIVLIIEIQFIIDQLLVFLNRYVLIAFLKFSTDVIALISVGILFQSLGPYTLNE